MTETTTDRAQRQEPPKDAPPRGTFGLLADPLFGPYFIGKLLSTVGVWVFSMVAAVVMWDLTGSAVAVGSVSVAQFVPQLVFAPLSGAQADRGSPKRQLFVGRLLVAAGATLATLALWSPDREAVVAAWMLLGAAAVVGVGFVVGGPAQHSLIPSMVRRSEVSQAVALNALAPIIARAGGPILGTIVLVQAGATWAFSLAVVTNLVFAAIILRLPLEGLVERARGGSHTVRQGLTYLRANPAVAYLLLAMLGVGIGADPMITLTPALSAKLGHGETMVGILAGGFGVGAAVAYLVIGPMRVRHGDRAMTASGLASLAGGLLTAGLASTPSLAVAGLGTAGFGFCWALTGATTRIYGHVPEEFRGRMMALWSIAFVGSRPLSAAFSGALADVFSVAVGFVGIAALVLGLGVWAHMGTSRQTARAS